MKNKVEPKSGYIQRTLNPQIFHKIGELELLSEYWFRQIIRETKHLAKSSVPNGVRTRKAVNPECEMETPHEFTSIIQVKQEMDFTFHVG